MAFIKPFYYKSKTPANFPREKLSFVRPPLVPCLSRVSHVHAAVRPVECQHQPVFCSPGTIPSSENAEKYFLTDGRGGRGGVDRRKFIIGNEREGGKYLGAQTGENGQKKKKIVKRLADSFHDCL